ncbi:hypothetical protein PAXRUDRAFT_158369 [Paxillus rubicundulus Ve08.2h10]|uniref:Uncharacterized protein n=1 Tax=Paxillus rubicundulus Ve08.2h10 TaxID=930991 RepID=A0A0D0DGV6_9AGAM|nr:hypothetical protein PAXRUDRAFT_158369 [Paxillus rubicundulus Ve08.2h10]
MTYTPSKKDQVSLRRETTNNCAPTGRDLRAVPSPTTPFTTAQDVAPHPTAHTDALALKTHSLPTPYKHDVWERVIHNSNLAPHFAHLLNSFHSGFKIDFPPIAHVQTPPNNESVNVYKDAFSQILNKEISKSRYIGPFSALHLSSIIGPFQSSPLSIIPKPGCPSKFRLVQNFSYPITPSPQSPNPSINSQINTENFPASWGKFSIIYLLISCLPPGSEVATRDIAEAYRRIPLHPSQWPSRVIQAVDDQFFIDTCLAFGASPLAGVYGEVADAGAKIFRSKGIGPLNKWVDDHIFIRIKREHMINYNMSQALWCHQIVSAEGLRRSGSRIWLPGAETHDGIHEEFNEDCTNPIRDLSQDSPHSPHDAQSTYNMSDIDAISETLGIPWEVSKDQPFRPLTIYIGFKWDLEAQIVSLAPEKVTKYLEAIHSWNAHATHTLKDVKQLYGKLLHVCAVIPRGQAYLTGLEHMLSTCSDQPFMPHHPIESLVNDLEWWCTRLTHGDVQCPIKPPSPYADHQAFSDASSSMGIGIVIGNRWAEAVGFELLIRTLDQVVSKKDYFTIFGDNTGIVEGWWNGRHHNTETNQIFRRVHDFLTEASHILNIRAKYIPSASNPADGPSRGIFPPRSLLLPRIALSHPLLSLIIDVVDLPASPGPYANAQPRIPATASDIFKYRCDSETCKLRENHSTLEDNAIRETLTQKWMGLQLACPSADSASGRKALRAFTQPPSPSLVLSVSPCIYCYGTITTLCYICLSV